MQRLELRKRKFGIADEESKKVARAARFGLNKTGNTETSNKKTPAIDSGNDLVSYKIR